MTDEHWNSRRADRMVRHMARKYSPPSVSIAEALRKDYSFYRALFRAYHDHYEWRRESMAMGVAPLGRGQLKIVLVAIRAGLVREFEQRELLDRAPAALAAAAAVQKGRGLGNKQSAVNRRTKSVGRDRRVHDLAGEAKTPQQIEGIVQSEFPEDLWIGTSQIRKVLQRPRP